MLNILRSAAKAVVPPQLRLYVARQRTNQLYRGLSPKVAFERTYSSGAWGSSSELPFFSGTGSHDPKLVIPYVEAVKEFLTSLPKKPNVLDLGCGDFSVGKQIRPYCQDYIACDIVPALIEFNRGKYTELNVDFRVVDLVHDELPTADVVFIRQVFQHLSNAFIAGVLPKIAEGYSYLVLTEHLPAGPFRPNRDKPTGPTTRIEDRSGIDLKCEPFCLHSQEERVICEAAAPGGLLRTSLFRLR